ncbi:MAG: hypothetical protein AB1568_16270 [Thermodesulfobacteriota bacterium]
MAVHQRKDGRWLVYYRRTGKPSTSTGMGTGDKFYVTPAVGGLIHLPGDRVATRQAGKPCQLPLEIPFRAREGCAMKTDGDVLKNTLVFLMRESDCFRSNLEKSHAWATIEPVLQVAISAIENEQQLNVFDVFLNLDSIVSGEDLFNIHGLLSVLRAIDILGMVRHKGHADSLEVMELVTLSYLTGAASQNNRANEPVREALHRCEPMVVKGQRFTPEAGGEKMDRLSRVMMDTALSYQEKHGRLPKAKKLWDLIPEGGPIVGKQRKTDDERYIEWENKGILQDSVNFKAFQERNTTIRKKIKKMISQKIRVSD